MICPKTHENSSSANRSLLHHLNSQGSLTQTVTWKERITAKWGSEKRMDDLWRDFPFGQREFCLMRKRPASHTAGTVSGHLMGLNIATQTLSSVHAAPALITYSISVLFTQLQDVILYEAANCWGGSSDVHSELEKYLSTDTCKHAHTHFYCT